MKNEQKQDQLQPIEVSERSLTVMNDNPNMEGSIELEPGNYVTSQSLIEKYHRLEDELEEKEDYIEVLESKLIEIADSLYHRGEAIKEMMDSMKKCISSHVGEALSCGNRP